MTCGPEGVLPLYDIDLWAAMLKVVDDRGFKAMHSLEKRMPSSKWCIELKDMGKKIWTSTDNRYEFDNYEDYERHEEEIYRQEMKREEEAEERWWHDERVHRRNDPCWKNDSDYD
ncbi:hypothetical protein GGS24DRAFT_479210 [Hypoxylon argillaceum]|nr:hypothetical protein GGS24DRAFT_479210 [Hypoxylon argillaceum]